MSSLTKSNHPKIKAAAKAARRIDVSKIIAKQLPGWQLAETSVPVDLTGMMASYDNGVMLGVTLEDLRKRVFDSQNHDSRANEHADAGVETVVFGGKQIKTVTVRIQPKSGGPTKVADISADGKTIKVVQG